MKRVAIILLIPFFIACAVVMFNKRANVKIDQNIRQHPAIEINIDTDTLKREKIHPLEKELNDSTGNDN